jgi:hypothetical protein
MNNLKSSQVIWIKNTEASNNLISFHLDDIMRLRLGINDDGKHLE